MNLKKTPLRYPGGKQKLSPFLKEILIANDLIGGHYCEPYAGGAGAAIQLLLDKQISDIHLNDSSFAIFAFWESILNKTNEFCDLILSASLTIKEWRHQQQILKNPSKYSIIEVGFSTFYLNRCNRSGVLNGGVIGGLNQDGEWKMDARFTRNDLITRIEAIAYHKKNIHISNMDAEKYIGTSIPKTPKNTLVYCDPPYFEKASELYLDHYNKNDHERLSKTIQEKIKRKWVLSYDATDEIISYYRERNHFTYNLQYNAARVYKGKEVFVFSDDLILPVSSTLNFIDVSVKDMHLKNSIRRA